MSKAKSSSVGCFLFPLSQEQMIKFFYTQMKSTNQALSRTASRFVYSRLIPSMSHVSALSFLLKVDHSSLDFFGCVIMVWVTGDKVNSLLIAQLVNQLQLHGIVFFLSVVDLLAYFSVSIFISIFLSATFA